MTTTDVFSLVLSKHAKVRRKQMGVTERQVEEVVDDPDVVYPHAGRTVFQRGDLAVVMDKDVAVTVLWRKTERYERDR